MGKISVLNIETANKIAAGEVVERPASVIKELVENSIDAGASNIVVEIKKGGTLYMRVSDNGSGMERADAEICFLRHATSKIKTGDDLNAIYTLGFRGEALSSIGAVSKTSLYTKHSVDAEGVCVTCEGGEIKSTQSAGT
ncbi:MAG: DNA mismatch repair endonuclease MutL, partial [Oscillospiraceae bacterium]|nr:DNA mismatch repair endonuclease MutL [Oscillospiraceae bacterium]